MFDNPGQHENKEEWAVCVGDNVDIPTTDHGPDIDIDGLYSHDP